MSGIEIFFQNESFTSKEEANLIDISVYLLANMLLGSIVGIINHLAETAGSFDVSLLIIEELHEPET
jgi:hypothetical protein